MKFITNIKELEGKTIKKAIMMRCDEGCFLFFADATCAFFDTGGGEVILVDTMFSYQKADAGLISEAEYDEIKAAENKEQISLRRAQELKELERLKAKYGKN